LQSTRDVIESVCKEVAMADGGSLEVRAGERRRARLQVAALCWRRKAGALQVLLITSRETRRWILPKGWPIRGLDLHQAAAREAWEEAGVRPERVGRRSVGSYFYRKTMPRGKALPCRTEVYPVEVRKLAKDFPERKERRRRWLRPAKAARLVAEPELRQLLREL
jgi:8-oxo-dGTP pyrophosphatase MutT (NUDIX family)